MKIWGNIKIWQKMLVVAFGALAAGCTTNSLSGQFTAVSSFNVRNLKYDIATDTTTQTRGESCWSYVLGININKTDIRLQRAIDIAIRKGQAQGIDGDLLTNVRVYNEVSSYLVYSSDCIIVEGDLVKILP